MKSIRVKYRKPLLLILFAALVANSDPSWAYIGPGLGGGVIAVILGIFGAVVMLIFGIFWYPIKKFFKRKEAEGNPEDKEKDQPEDE